MKNVLIVEDEKSFMLNLLDGFSAYAGDFNMLTAENGKIAMEIMEASNVDLIVTDLKMPLTKGFELLDYISKNHSLIPVIVTTAFWSLELEQKLQALGVRHCLKKPLEFDMLMNKIIEQLTANNKSYLGYLRGIGLPGFLQLVEMEKKTYTLTIRSKEKTGQLYFLKGKLMDAQTKNLQGEKAAYDIISWDPVEIDIEEDCKKNKCNINSTVTHILLEGLRLKDETSIFLEGLRLKDETSPGVLKKEEISKVLEKEADESKSLSLDDLNELDQFSLPPDKNILTVQNKLKELASIDNFVGAGIFTPAGEALVTIATNNNVNMKELGALANNVLISAQKASRNMRAGRSQLVYVEAEKAHILVRCYNEGTDLLKSQPGKVHIHLVLVLDSEASIGMGKLKVGKVIESLAEDFRGGFQPEIPELIKNGAF